MYFKPEFKERLVAALRSGKYEQTSDTLREDSSSMCCLGVACDLFDPTCWSYDGKYHRYLFDARSYALETDSISKSTIDDAGLPFVIVRHIATWDDVAHIRVAENKVPTFLFNENQRDRASEILQTDCEDLAEMNDKGATFDQIADFIEAHC